MTIKTDYDWEMEVGQGWRQIIRAVVSTIQNSGGTIRQIKEKFGGLRIYFYHPDDATNFKLNSLVDSAEEICSVICENCGRPGKLRNITGWMKTYCDACSCEEIK